MMGANLGNSGRLLHVTRGEGMGRAVGHHQGSGARPYGTGDGAATVVEFERGTPSKTRLLLHLVFARSIRRNTRSGVGT